MRSLYRYCLIFARVRRCLSKLNLLRTSEITAIPGSHDYLSCDLSRRSYFPRSNLVFCCCLSSFCWYGVFHKERPTRGSGGDELGIWVVYDNLAASLHGACGLAFIQTWTIDVVQKVTRRALPCVAPQSRRTSARKCATVLPPTEIGWHILDTTLKPSRYLERSPTLQAVCLRTGKRQFLRLNISLLDKNEAIRCS